jgi:hypothetical protein
MDARQRSDDHREACRAAGAGPGSPAARCRRRYLAVVLMVAVGASVILASIACGGIRPGSGSAVARGQAIFQSGVDANGVSIPRTVSANGTGMMGGAMGRGMAGGGCTSCHGWNGRGRTTPQFAAPNITYANLTDPRGMLMPDGTRGPTYTDAGIKKAVTRGIDPSGDRLESPMPRWQLSNGQWDDLLAYLKTLR